VGQVQQPPVDGDAVERSTPLVLEGKMAISKARAVLNDQHLLFLPSNPILPTDEASDEQPSSAALSAWSSARTTPTKSSKSASIHTSCCPSDTETVSDDGERGSEGLLRPAIRRSRRLRKSGRGGQCYRHRAKYHHLPDLPQQAQAAASRLRAEAHWTEGEMTPKSSKSGSTQSTPPDVLPQDAARGGNGTMQSPHRKELASLFAALSSDGYFEDADEF
jgi:hypothetical protein